jgi:hypothetical protein
VSGFLDDEQVRVVGRGDDSALMWLPVIDYLDTQAYSAEVAIPREYAVELFHALGAWLAGPDDVQFQVAGDWGVDGADSAEHAAAKVRRFLAAYPNCRAEASRRVAIEFLDGGEYYGPWQDLVPTETTEGTR